MRIKLADAETSTVPIEPKRKERLEFDDGAFAARDTCPVWIHGLEFSLSLLVTFYALETDAV